MYQGATTAYTPKTPAQPTQQPGNGLVSLDTLGQQRLQLAKQMANMNQPLAQVADPWQGMSYLAEKVSNSLQGEREQGQETATRSKLADLLGQASAMPKGPDQGMISQISGLDYETGKALYDQAVKAREDAATMAHQDALEKMKIDAASAQAGTFKPSDIGAVRDDYTNAAKTYDQAAPSWQSMKEAAATSLAPDNAENAAGKGAADYNMIVGFAKLLDPNSVVREGEVSSATNLGGHIDTVQSWLNQWKANGGKLDDNVRKAIMTQGDSRMRSYYDQVKTKRDWISGIAKRHGVLEEDVVAPLGEYAGWADPTKAPDPNKPTTEDPNAPDMTFLPVKPDGSYDFGAISDDQIHKLTTPQLNKLIELQEADRKKGGR